MPSPWLHLFVVWSLLVKQKNHPVTWLCSLVQRSWEGFVESLPGCVCAGCVEEAKANYSALARQHYKTNIQLDFPLDKMLYAFAFSLFGDQLKGPDENGHWKWAAAFWATSPSQWQLRMVHFCMVQIVCSRLKSWVIWKPDSYELQLPMWGRNCPL